MRANNGLGFTFEVPTKKQQELEIEDDSALVVECKHFGYASYRSLLSFFSLMCAMSVASFLSLLCLLSVASAGSVLSVGSVGSVLSMFSAGSILSIGCTGEILKICL